MLLIVMTYVGIGLLFGLLTYPTRHLYSEGPTRPDRATDATAGQALGSRVFWLLMASYSWPLMLLTRAFSWWHKREA